MEDKEYYHDVVKGKAPKNAPTYVEEIMEKSEANRYKCLLCGYIYDDSKESVKFEDLLWDEIKLSKKLLNRRHL